jgi:plasmid stabilization system protein ParE
MGYKVILSPIALEDFRQIVTYIAQNDPAFAQQLGHWLLDQAEMLGYLPHTAHPRQGWLPRR